MNAAPPPQGVPPLEHQLAVDFPPPPHTPLAPSVEKAYYRKCIQLKRRLNEVEAANEESRTRRVRLDRAIMKMRLERAFLLEQMAKRMNGDLEGSEANSEAGDGVGTPPRDRPHLAKRRRTSNAAPSSSATMPPLQNPYSSNAPLIPMPRDTGATELPPPPLHQGPQPNGQFATTLPMGDGSQYGYAQEQAAQRPGEPGGPYGGAIMLAQEPPPQGHINGYAAGQEASRVPSRGGDGEVSVPGSNQG